MGGGFAFGRHCNEYSIKRSLVDRFGGRFTIEIDMEVNRMGHCYHVTVLESIYISLESVEGKM
jgi:hypothetical protein